MNVSKICFNLGIKTMDTKTLHNNINLTESVTL